VSSTAGEVLAVPLAALTAGPGGEARVEVLDGDTGTLVEVTTGLAADGFVEVSAVDGDLGAGDRVVVGQDGGGAGAAEGDEGDDEAADDEGADEAGG
jgi:multidrug efflux pump subunit AcrA (membrane-fusion protein)